MGFKVNPHRVNIDYEFELFDSAYNPLNRKNKKVCEEFEFIYFFTEKNELNLSTGREYDSEYLSYLETILEKKIAIYPFDLSASPWWGSFEDIDTKRITNSKEFSFTIAKNLNLLTEMSFFINSSGELPELNPNQKYLVKSPYLMSGRGQSLYDVDNIPETPFLLEPYHNVIEDFGIRVCFEKGVLYCVELKNLNGKQFSGGKIINLPEIFDSNILIAIAKEYQLKGVKKSIQIDCYTYENNIRYLVEANDRKTMGDFIYSQYELFNNSSGGRGLYVENIQIRTFKDMRSFLGKNIYSPESKKGVIPCSPPGNLKTWLYEVE